jgi:hypothetical protein
VARQEDRPMRSEVSISNMALSWLGQNPITSLDEQTREASICKANYDFVRDAVLEERRWTFATVRATSTVADLDEWGRMYSHPKPLNWLFVYRAYRNVSGETPSSWCKSEGWRMEGGKVLTRDATVYLWGTERVTNTDRFTEQFAQALTARLAATMCVAFTQDVRNEAMLWNKYQAFLADAAATDGMQGANEQVQSNQLIDSRFGGIGGR